MSECGDKIHDVPDASTPNDGRKQHQDSRPTSEELLAHQPRGGCEVGPLGDQELEFIMRMFAFTLQTI